MNLESSGATITTTDGPEDGFEEASDDCFDDCSLNSLFAAVLVVALLDGVVTRVVVLSAMRMSLLLLGR